MQERCNQLLEDLAAIVDGDEQLLEKHLDHLSECDSCRDARHEAVQAAAAIADAGADYQHPADFGERVTSAVDEQTQEKADSPEGSDSSKQALSVAKTVESKVVDGSSGTSRARPVLWLQKPQIRSLHHSGQTKQSPGLRCSADGTRGRASGRQALPQCAARHRQR